MAQHGNSTLQQIRAAYTQEKSGLDLKQGGWLDRYFWRPISFYLTVPFVKAGFSANQVTILSHVVGVIGLIFLAVGTYISLIAGSFLFSLYIMLDYVDGNIARLRGPSHLGHLLDTYPWTFTHIALPFCLAVGLYSHPDWLMQQIGIVPYNGNLIIWGLFGSLFSANNDLALWMYMVNVENHVATVDAPVKPRSFWGTLLRDLSRLSTTYYFSLLLFTVIGCGSFYLFFFVLGRILRFPLLVVSHLTTGFRLLDKG